MPYTLSMAQLVSLRIVLKAALVVITEKVDLIKHPTPFFVVNLVKQLEQASVFKVTGT